jgi:SAM-dependent methyltransferase
LEKVVKYKKMLDDIEKLIYVNEAVCESMVANAMQFYGIDQVELDKHMKQAEKDGRQADKFAVSQTLKHYVRDWADEGAKERGEAFPCITSILSNLKSKSTESTLLKVLLPGSGVGRLGHNVANLEGQYILSTYMETAHIVTGFEVTINEWSMFMNVGYRWIETQRNVNSFAIHPFIDGMSHQATKTDMLRSITTPNISPNPSVLLVEGDFNTAFNDRPGYYDIIVTHFFIDTARNLMAYFDTIHRLLQPGGSWINFGPLFYGTGPFVQLSLEDIIDIVEEMGFEFENLGDECGELTFEGKKVRSKEAEYGFNKRALTRHAYLAQVWMVRKL